MDAALRELKDRLEIHDLLNRYARMVDFREWERMDEVFAPGARIDYTSTGGVAGPFRETLAWLDRALAPWPTNLHFITNVTVDFEAAGERASSRCYFHAPMAQADAQGGQTVITNAGYYDDRLVRTGAGWRIAERHCQQTLMIGRLPDGYRIPS